jgi:hypothetical protein
MTKRRTAKERRGIALRAIPLRQAPFQNVVKAIIARKRLARASWLNLQAQLSRAGEKSFFIRAGFCCGKKSHNGNAILRG